MKFNFPTDKKTESVTISIYDRDIKKIRSLAEKYKCTQQDIYKTIINEALEEYEEKNGLLIEVDTKQKYSVKRDLWEAGDNKRNEALGENKFDGGGDLRTKEEKVKEIIPIQENEDKLNKFGHKIVGWSYAHDSCIECGTTDERRHMAKGFCTKCYYHNNNPKKLPKNWYKKDVLQHQVDEIIHRKPLPQNFGVIAYCNYILCAKKKFNLADGIEHNDKKFCSEECYARWNKSIENIRSPFAM